MSYYTTPNMSLTEPNVLQESAPQWAQDLNNSLTLIDQHDHSSGKGVKITPAGLNISTDLSFNTHAATALLNAQFSPYVTLPAVSSIVDRIFASTVTGRDELFWQDSTGANVQLTSQGAVNQASTSVATNGFTGAGYSTSGGGAAAVWTAGSSLYSFTANGSTLAAVAASDGYFYDALNIASAGSGITPHSGVQIISSATQAFVFSPIASGGGLSDPVLDFLNSTATLRVNPLTTPMTAGVASLDVYSLASGVTPFQTARLVANYFGGQVIGQGAALGLWSSDSSTTQKLQGIVGGAWNAIGGNASLQLTAASGGTLASVAGLTITNFAGTQAIGLLGAAVTGQVTTYADFFPSGDNTRNTGSDSFRWASVNTMQVRNTANSGELRLLAGSGGGAGLVNTQSDSGLNVRNLADSGWAQLSSGNLTANGNATVNGNLTVTGSITGNAGLNALQAVGKFIVPVAPTGTSSFIISEPGGLMPSTGTYDGASQSWSVFNVVLSAPVPGSNPLRVLLTEGDDGTIPTVGSSWFTYTPQIYIDSAGRQNLSVHVARLNGLGGIQPWLAGLTIWVFVYG